MLNWMMTWQDVLPVLAVLYVLLCVVYAIDCFYTDGSLQETLYSFIVCLFLPIVGFVFVWMQNYFTKKKQPHDLSLIMQEEGFFADDLAILHPMDRTEELSHVPMEEALLVNDYEFRCKRVMETLKLDDTMAYMGVLRLAMENEDTETSHYASAIIMLLQEQMQASLRQKSYAWEKDQSKRSLGCAYEAELYRLLTSELMDAQSLHRYYIAYAQLSDVLLDTEMPEETLLQHRVNICVVTNDFTTAAQTVERYLSLYPESEEAVYQKIMLCVQTRDRSALDSFCESLAYRPVVLTKRVLDYIRFFALEPS